jgi:hypothetical protein
MPFWMMGQEEELGNEVNGTPRCEIECAPDCVPEVLIAAPPKVRDKLKVFPDTFFA